MVPYERLWVCARCKPAFFQRILEGAPLATTGGTAWSSGQSVVVPLGGPLPARCVRCNRAPDGKLIKRTLYWHQPWLYVLLISPLIYVIVALLVRKTAKIEIPLCARDRSRWQTTIAISAIGAVVALVAFFVAVAYEQYFLSLVAGIGFVTALVLGISRSQLLTAHKIDQDYIWLRGASAGYRRMLPEMEK